MKSLDAFLIALAIILIIIVVYQNRKFFDKSQVKSTTLPVAEHWVNCNDPANNLNYQCSQQFENQFDMF